MSKFRQYLKWSFASLAIVAMTWALVIFWWQTTRRVATNDDTLLYLVILPATAVTAFTLALWLRNRARASDTQSNPQATPADSFNLQEPGSADDHALTTSIMAAWAITNVASNADEFPGSLAERKIRPAPDEVLTDADGYPLLTGRIATLDTATVDAYLKTAVNSGKCDDVPPQDEWREAFVRTLALLAELMEAIQDEWPFPTETFSRANAERTANQITLRGAPASASEEEPALMLQIKLLVPDHFQPWEKRLVLSYLSEKASILQPSRQPLQIELVPAQNDTVALLLSDQFNINTSRDSVAHAMLVLACDSTLCDSVSESWQADGRLFSAGNPSGFMLGEAAFGVLYANERAQDAIAGTPLCKLARIATATRDFSADMHGKPSSTSLITTVHDALIKAGIAAESIGAVATDADHRTSRALECMGAMLSATPHLDAVENRFAVNEACGHLGAASVLGAIVAGAMHATAAACPVLLFNVSHATERAAAILLPLEDTTT
ncbi:hypothetical protein D3870_09040 [Noviherbaspirillum cavernae]|uniref:3-oxoacyl-ACP synthase n=1 Tax=Noviherbaspirillum cavernae TaxID=2320862 RepID=A0A418X0Y0_9BURK|nr:hypothetical protein [Noviherbaspirillum cavernae]RJG06129.1 hypothetical protein D3870_09040 [Noviherbaspirillum cavernae]